ncbi:MAG: ferredoxin, partial [Sideroxydans sp.]
SECVTLEGNPSLDRDWLEYNLDYLDEAGTVQKMTLPLTFADFALTEGRFAKQFKKAPPETWNDDMVLLADFLKLSADEREGKFPFIWAVDKKQSLLRALVSQEMVNACIERLQLWQQMKDVAGLDRPAANEEEVAARVRTELLQRITDSLGSSASVATPGASSASPATAPATAFDAVWIDTPECTACDECTNLNPKIFAYNDQNKAIVINPTAGTFLDIVKAAEKCTAGIIHPGTPWNPNEANLDKLAARAARFN